MKSYSLISIMVVCLVASANAAPAALSEDETPAPTTTVASLSTQSSQPAQTTTPTPSTPSDLASSAPATQPLEGVNTTASMAVSSSHDAVLNSSSSFTCYGRSVGYYADVEHECKVYHFCLLGEFNGDSVYQRISYLCLNETIFDQQALDCVESSKMSAPCKESTTYYDMSNSILRQAILSTQMHQSNETGTATKVTTPSS